MAGKRGSAPACVPCDDAIVLDQLAIIKLEDAELGVIACETHLRRLVLALDVLDAVEAVEAFTIPPLADVAFRDRLVVEPNRPVTS